MKIKKKYPFITWFLSSLFFFFVYIVRIEPSLIIADLKESFNINSYQIGKLSAFFYYSYIFMQIPVGILISKFNIKKILVFSIIVTGLSCIIFSISPNLLIAEISRLVMGFSSSFAFVSTMIIITMYFSKNYLGLLSGLTQSSGMFGAAFGSIIVLKIVSFYGWRKSYLISSIIFFILALLIFFIMKIPQNFYPKNPQKKIKYFNLLKKVIKNKYTWYTSLYVGLLYCPNTVFAELWGINFISITHKFNLLTSTKLIGAIFIGWGIGGPIIGWLSDFYKKKFFFLSLSSISSFILLSIIIYFPLESKKIMFLLMFLYGIGNTGVGIGYALSSRINKGDLSSISVAFVNMFSIIIGSFMQPFIGFFIDRFLFSNDKVLNFKISLFFLPLGCLISLFYSFKLKKYLENES